MLVAFLMPQMTHGLPDDYRKLLETISAYFEIVRLRDGEGKRKRCLLRHDVDNTLDGSVRIAEIEHDFGVSSTYFMLHTAPYYEKEDFIDRCKHIQKMGHEVGFHNNIINFCIENPGFTPKQVLEKELRFLRENNIEVYGTSSHGSALCRRKGYTNYEVFKECVRPYTKRTSSVEGIPLHTLSLSDYGLYEAYFLFHDYYITDSTSGGPWRCLNKKEHDEWVPNFLKMKRIPRIRRLVRDLGKSDRVKNIQFLTHATHWSI